MPSKKLPSGYLVAQGLEALIAMHALKHWLFRFRVASLKLKKAEADFTDWLSNNFPSWAEYQALTSGWLCALDISPGVCPVGVG
jgi:hypothetical protein